MAARAHHCVPDYPRDRPTVPEVQPLVRAYYAKPGNEAGGCCHVALDDGNLDAETLEWTRSYCLKHGDEDGAALMRLLLAMTPTQRRAVQRG